MAESCLRSMPARLMGRRVDHGHYVLLVRARGKFGYHAAVFFVHALAAAGIAQQQSVGNHCRRKYRRGDFDSQSHNIIHFYSICLKYTLWRVFNNIS